MSIRVGRWSAVAGSLLVSLVIAGCGGGGGGGGAPPAPVPPAIATAPAPATVADGATATFSVAATGDAPLSFRWRRDGTDLADGAGVTGSATASLSLVAPYALDGSRISVRVTNGAGTVLSGDALLTVTPVAPTIATPPAGVSVAAGGSATFSVTLGGGTAPIAYQWLRGGIAIAGATAPSYTLAPVATGDNGATFAVRITNPAGTITSSAAALTVTAAPRSWGPAIQIDGGAAGNDPGYPQVAIDTAGNALAVWQQRVAVAAGGTRNAVWASRYAAGGAWSTAATIDTGVGSAIRPRLAMTPSGVASAVFSQTIANTGGKQRANASRFDGTWSAAVSVDDPASITNASDPAVGIAPGGAATLAYAQSDGTGSRIWAARSSAAGVWGAAGVIDAGAPSFLPEVATGANGHSVVTWVQETGVFTRALWAARNTGSGWSAPARVTPDTGANNSVVRVVVDGAGNAVAVWAQTLAGGRPTIRAARLDAATGTWSAPVSLNDGTRDALFPELALDGAGNVVVVWAETDGVWSARGTAAGAWSAAQRVQPAGAPVGTRPKIGVDATGQAIAVWLQPVPGNFTRYELWSAQAAGAGAWSASSKLMVDPAAYVLLGSDQEPQIAVNASGEAVVVWFQRTDAPSSGIWSRVYR